MGYRKWQLNPKVAPTVRAEHHNTASVHFIASGPTNGTNMQAKYIKNIMENVTPETSEQSTQARSQTTISSVLAFLVNHLASPEKDWDLKTPEGLCFLKSLGLSETKDPDIFSLKMLRGYLVMTKEKLSRQYLGFSPIWGMSINGKFLTARISEFPRTGSGSSLSDILEEQVDRKYFLSAKATQFLIRRSMQNKQEGRGFRARLMPVMDHSEMPEKPTSITSEALKEKEICG